MAFTDGVRPGGLSDSREIKILICYMLMGVESPLSRDAIRDILVYNQMANMFEVVSAIEELLENGSVTEDEHANILLTENGKVSATQLVELIPYTVRDQALKAAMQLTARSRFEKETKVDIQKVDGGYAVTCSIDKSDSPMMSFTLRVTDELQAKAIQENFLNNPTLFYRGLIGLSTGDYTEENNSVSFPLF